MDKERTVHASSIEMRSKEHAKRISISDDDPERGLSEGFLGTPGTGPGRGRNVKDEGSQSTAHRPEEKESRKMISRVYETEVG